MDVHRCDQCGVEAPDHVRMFKPTADRWWNVGREYHITFNLCSWECVRAFVAAHSSAPTPLVEQLDAAHKWNAEKQQYEKPTPQKRRARKGAS